MSELLKKVSNLEVNLNVALMKVEDEKVITAFDLLLDIVSCKMKLLDHAFSIVDYKSQERFKKLDKPES